MKKGKRIGTFLLAVAISFAFAGASWGLTIFSDAFDDNLALAGWDRSSTTYAVRDTGSYKVGEASFKICYNAWAETFIKVGPYKNMKLNFKLAAVNLEAGDELECVYDIGTGWKTAGAIGDGGDTGVFKSVSVSVPCGTILRIRFRMMGNAADDAGYVDDLSLTGDRK